MSVRRKRFRIEEVFGTTAPVEAEGGAMPMHNEIMSELRAIRAQMAAPAQNAVSDEVTASTNMQVAEAQALLATYRAQIEQCEKLKIELDLIHDAINRTKMEIATLHG